MSADNQSIASLSAGEIRALTEQGIVKTFARNTVVVSEGDDTSAFYLLVSGHVKVYVSNEDGREVVLRTHGPGEYFGEMALDGQARSASVATTEASQLVMIPISKFRDFVRDHPEFATRLIANLISRIRGLTENVKSLALMDVYGRVARLMLELAVNEDGQLVVPGKMTQQDIADRVGASREMVSRIFKDLVQGGYISIERKRITINKKPPQHW